jgi:asparagine synthase (glutamine-hydrolysing)
MKYTTTGVAAVVMHGRSAHDGIIARMVARMTHRGPDVSSFVTRVDADSRADLGYVGIVDEPDDVSAWRPVEDSGVGSVAVIDGVVTNIDSLVIRLEAIGCPVRGRCATSIVSDSISRWGETVFGVLDGHFAVVHYDPQRRRLLLARDALGVKPLYWARSRDGCGVIVASEIRAILASGHVSADYDTRGIASYLAYGHSHAPQTIHREIHEVPAGCWQEIRFDGGQIEPLEPVRYWCPPPVDPAPMYGAEIERIRGALHDTVAELATGLPTASGYLPGDVESAVLAVLASRYLQEFRTAFVDLESEGHIERARVAAAVAQELQSHHFQMIVDEEWGRSLWQEWLASADSPCVEGYDTYLICQAIKNTGAVAAMLPAGGTELFRGSPFFAMTTRLVEMASIVKRSPRWLRSALRQRMVTASSPMYRGLVEDACTADATTMSAGLHARRVFRSRDLEQIGLGTDSTGLSESCLPVSARAALPESGDDVFADLTRLQLYACLPNRTMRACDVGGMGNSLQLLLPYASRRVADCLATLPGSLMSPKPSRSGAAIQKVASRMLPYNLLVRQEPRPRFPFTSWMTGPLRGFVDECVSAVVSCPAIDGEALHGQWLRIIDHARVVDPGKALAVVALGASMRQMARERLV